MSCLLQKQIHTPPTWKACTTRNRNARLLSRGGVASAHPPNVRIDVGALSELCNDFFLHLGHVNHAIGQVHECFDVLLLVRL